jgi:hypothetical protein
VLIKRGIKKCEEKLNIKHSEIKEEKNLQRESLHRHRTTAPTESQGPGVGTLTKIAKAAMARRPKKMPTKIMMRPTTTLFPTTPSPVMMPLQKSTGCH